MAGLPDPWRGICCVAALFIVTACSEDSSQRLGEVSAGYLDALLVNQDFDAWSAFFQPGARLNGSQLAATVMAGYARGLHHAFPDMTLRVIEQIAADNRVVTRFVIQGTHKGAFNALPPTNRTVELEGVAIDHFEAGLIVSTRLMLDLSQLNSRLRGATPGTD